MSHIEVKVPNIERALAGLSQFDKAEILRDALSKWHAFTKQNESQVTFSHLAFIDHLEEKYQEIIQ